MSTLPVESAWSVVPAVQSGARPAPSTWRRPAAERSAGAEPLPLEEAVHKVAILGFVALTLGLAVGAVWGKVAWGQYWSWDPKENWAFITWLAYLGCLHLRLTAGWRGEHALWVNLACFGAAMFTYLGMHLLPAASGSLHVYQ
jgi:ABC-type transport system involved in cytochrome c biogenesis permease subunit